MKDKIEIIIRHTSAGQTQQFYGVNHYEPEEALRRFHAIGSEANEMHLRLMQDSEMELSPTLDLLEALKALTSNPHVNLGDLVYEVRDSEGEGWDGPQVKAWSDAVQAAAAAIAKAERRGA